MKKKWLWIGLGVIILLTTAVIIVLTLPSKTYESTLPVQNTTQVIKGDIVVKVSGSGSVISTDNETVRTKDEGKVKEVLVTTDDVVKKGQVLLTFEATDNSDSLYSKESTLQQQKLDLVDLQEQYKRQVQEGATEENINSTQKSITKQELNIKSTERDIASLKEAAIPPDPLTSPIDGTITTVNIAPGERASNGSELFIINDYQKLSVNISVDELDIPSVTLGMAATISLDALPDQTFEGKVSSIANEGTPSNGVSLFAVTIEVSNPTGARVGMSAEANIIVSEKKAVLTLPIETVRKMGDKYIVTLPTTQSGNDSATKPTDDQPATKPSTGGTQSTDKSTAVSSRTGSGRPNNFGGQMKEVEVGIHDESSIEIVNGLNEGDKVVIPTVVAPASTTDASKQGSDDLSGGLGGFGGGMQGGGGMPDSGGGFRRSGGN